MPTEQSMQMLQNIALRMHGIEEQIETAKHMIDVMQSAGVDVGMLRTQLSGLIIQHEQWKHVLDANGVTY